VPIYKHGEAASAVNRIPVEASTDPTEPVAVRISDGDVFNSVQVQGIGAFGDVVTAEIHPQIQMDFVYGGHPDAIFTDARSGGTVSFSDSMLVLASGGSIGGKGHLHSRRVVRYRPGQGALFRFTALFDTPEIGNEQFAGCMGATENELGFGYDHLTGLFGVVRTHGGTLDIHTFIMTVAASGAETFTVTLDGVATNVPLTAGTLAENAQEVVNTVFAGWWVEADGTHIHFLADLSEPRTGTYSVSSTGTADASITNNVVGSAPTNDWVVQADWNHDKFNGKGPSGITIDQTRGNVFAISLQYLGFGAIDFYIENPDTGNFVLCHRYRYANANILPSVSDPTFALGGRVLNVSSTSNKTMKMGSLAGFVEGSIRLLGPNHGTDADVSVAAETPVLSIRNNAIYLDGVSRANLRDVIPQLVSVSGSGSNKPIKVRVVLNGVLTDPLWSDYDTTHSLAAVDTSATAITGGDIVLATSFSSGSGVVQDLVDLDLDLRPGDVLSVVVIPTGTAVDATASLLWKEDV